MPTLICKEVFSQCIQKHVSDAKSQRACKSNIDDLCGTLNPSKADVGSDDDEEDDDDDDEASETTATTAAPTATDDSTSEDSVTTTDSDDIAGPTPGPKGVAAMAALGLMVALA